MSAPAVTAADVLEQKRRFAQTLVSREAARTAFDKIKAAPRAARDGLMSLLRTFKLDALASWLGEKAASLYRLAVGIATGAAQIIGKVFGWRTLAVYAVANPTTRSAIGRGIVHGYLLGTAGLAKAGRLLSKVPFIGAPIVRWVSKPLVLADRYIVRGMGFVGTQVERVSDHWTFDVAQIISGAMLLGRGVRYFVPPQFRFLFWVTYFAAVVFKPAKAAIETLRSDEIVQAVVTEFKPVKEAAAAATARATDHVVDRAAEGPKNVGEVRLQVVATGETITLPVIANQDGNRVVTWEGEQYDVSDIGEGDNDPLKPIVDALTHRAQQADEARKSAEAVATPSPSPAGMMSANRATERILAASSGRKPQATAKVRKNR